MNKRVLVSLALLLLALALSVASYALLQHTAAKLGQALENAVYADLPVAEIHQSVDACAADSMRLLRVLTLHDELTVLETELDGLHDLLDAPDEYRRACRRCIRALQDVLDGQRVRADNIL